MDGYNSGLKLNCVVTLFAFCGGRWDGHNSGLKLKVCLSDAGFVGGMVM